MACIQCGNDVPVGNKGMCLSCGKKAGKEALETLKNASPSEKSVLAGAAAGAAIGSVVPVIGTVAGLLIGGFLGKVFGSED
jgi:phage tail tape-measure protein